MKARLGLLLLLVALFSGCVAVPPLISVQHHGEKNPDLTQRVNQLERRVSELEAKANE